VQFNSEVLVFFVFGLDDLSVVETGVLKSPIINVSGPIPPFMSNSIGCMKLGTPTFGAYVFATVNLLDGFFLLLTCSDLLYKVSFVRYEYSYSSLFCIPFAWNIISYPFIFICVYHCQ
jgi:hypothetical protein